MAEHLKEEDGAGHGSVKARHLPDHRNADVEVDPAANCWREALPLAPDHEADRPTKIGAAMVLCRLRLGAHHPNPSEAERRELIGEVLYAGDEKVLHSASARLNRGGREGGRATRRHQDAVYSNRLGAANQAAEVLRVFHPIERQDEGGLTTTHGTRKDLFRGNLWTASNHQGDPLMPIESGELADQRPLNFNDGDAQRCGVQHHLLQSGAALWHHEELDRLTSRGEGLLNWMSPSNQLLIWPYECECLRWDGAL